MKFTQQSTADRLAVSYTCPEVSRSTIVGLRLKKIDVLDQRSVCQAPSRVYL
mgnify:CR=1 FL=1